MSFNSLPVEDEVITQYSLKSNNKIFKKYPQLLSKYNEKCNISNRNNKPHTLFITKENFLQLILTREKINENYKIKNGNSNNYKENRRINIKDGCRECIILYNVENNKKYKEVNAYLDDDDILYTFMHRYTYGKFNLSDVCVIEETEYQKILKIMENEENKKINEEQKRKDEIKKEGLRLLKANLTNTGIKPTSSNVEVFSKAKTICFLYNALINHL